MHKVILHEAKKAAYNFAWTDTTGRIQIEMGREGVADVVELIQRISG
jgi:hypothetical protein